MEAIFIKMLFVSILLSLISKYLVLDYQLTTLLGYQKYTVQAC